MKNAMLTIHVTTGEESLPVPHAKVTIKEKNGTILYETFTNENGNTGYFSLEAPDVSLTLDPNYMKPAYAVYDVDISANGYITSHIHDVEAVATQTAILPVNLEPLTEEVSPVKDMDIYIPPIGLLSTEEKKTLPSLNSAPNVMPVIATPASSEAIPVVTQPATSNTTFRTVIIPEYITVHLSIPSNTNAANVRIKFIDYIKNVASSEIYATWPTNSLLANIHAIVTFALNRVYTEWYRSRGLNFDITNSTAYDQAFRYGGPIFESISKLVDNVFNVYARRIGFQNPFFTQFCNGTTVKCAGLSQWGTVDLANQGKTAIQILHYYYPKDLELVASNNITGIIESYPGYVQRRGYTSEHIRRMQNYLNRIRVNFPLIPRISNPNGYFGTDTEEAVRTFQRTFNLTVDGLIGRTTWNTINFIYVGVIRLGELDGEGERVGLSATPPTTTISQGARGHMVLELQFLLNAIAPYYVSVPTVIKDSVFDTVTKNSVIDFQKTFGLTPDGIVLPIEKNQIESARLS